MSKRLKFIFKLIYPFLAVCFLYLILTTAKEWNPVERIWLPGVIGVPLLGGYMYRPFTKEPNNIFQYFIDTIIVIGFISVALSGLFMCSISVFSMVGGPFYIAFLLYDIYPAYVISILGFFLFAIQIVLAFIFTIKHTTFYRLAIFLRKLLLLFAFIIVLYPCAVSTSLAWILANSNDKWFDLAIWSSVDCLVWLVLLVIFVKKFGLVDFYGNRFILFLRSFTNDDKDLFKKLLQKHSEPIIKIGNPTSFWGEDSLMLSNTNWEYWLDYYISRAKVVYVDISNTKGLLWEIFEHQTNLEKFIYIVRSKESLLGLMLMPDIKKYEKSHLYTLFMAALSNQNIPNVFSMTANGMVFFSIFPEKKEPNYTLDINSLALCSSENSPQKTSIAFFFIDLKRMLLQKFIRLSKYGILWSGGGVVFCVWLLCFVGGILFVIISAIEIFYDICELGLSTLERILSSFFGMGLGIEMVKGSIKFLKDE